MEIIDPSAIVDRMNRRWTLIGSLFTASATLIGIAGFQTNLEAIVNERLPQYTIPQIVFDGRPF